MKIRGQADGTSEILERNTTQDVQEQVVMYPYSDMAVASGPAGPVLAGPVFTAIFETAHAQIMNNKQHVWGTSYNLSSTRTFCDELYLVLIPRHGHSITNSMVQDDIPEEAHQQVN